MRFFLGATVHGLKEEEERDRDRDEVAGEEKEEKIEEEKDF